MQSFVKIRASLLELSSGNQLRTRKLKRPPGGVNVGGIRRKSKASFVFSLNTSVQSFVKIRASLLELSSGNQLRTRKLKRPPGGMNVGGILRKSKASFVFPFYTSLSSFVKIRASLLELSSGNQLQTRKLKRPPGGVNVGGIRRKSKASFVFPLYTSVQSFAKIRASLLELSSRNQL